MQMHQTPTSAFLIAVLSNLVMQVAFTGRLISRLGLPLALAALPLVAGVMLLAIAASPSPSTVACAEIMRKVPRFPELLKPGCKIPNPIFVELHSPSSNMT